MTHRVISTDFPSKPQPNHIQGILSRTGMPAGPYAVPVTLMRAASGRGRLHAEWCERIKYEVVPVAVDLLTFNEESCSQCYLEDYGSKGLYYSVLQYVALLRVNLVHIEQNARAGCYSRVERLSLAEWLTSDTQHVQSWLDRSRAGVDHIRRSFPQHTEDMHTADSVLDAFDQRVSALVNELTSWEPERDLMMQDLARQVTAATVNEWIDARIDSELGDPIAGLLRDYVRDWAHQRDAALYLNDSIRRALRSDIVPGSLPGPWLTSPQGDTAFDWLEAEFRARVTTYHEQLLAELEATHTDTLATAMDEVSVILTCTSTAPGRDLRSHSAANTLLGAGICIEQSERTWFGRVPHIVGQVAWTGTDPHGIYVVALGDWDMETMRIAAGLLDTQRIESTSDLERTVHVAEALVA